MEIQGQSAGAPSQSDCEPSNKVVRPCSLQLALQSMSMGNNVKLRLSFHVGKSRSAPYGKLWGSLDSGGVLDTSETLSRRRSGMAQHHLSSNNRESTARYKNARKTD